MCRKDTAAIEGPAREGVFTGEVHCSHDERPSAFGDKKVGSHAHRKGVEGDHRRP